MYRRRLEMVQDPVWYERVILGGNYLNRCSEFMSDLPSKNLVDMLGCLDQTRGELSRLLLSQMLRIVCVHDAVHCGGGPPSQDLQGGYVCQE